MAAITASLDPSPGTALASAPAQQPQARHSTTPARPAQAGFEALTSRSLERRTVSRGTARRPETRARSGWLASLRATLTASARITAAIRERVPQQVPAGRAARHRAAPAPRTHVAAPAARGRVAVHSRVRTAPRPLPQAASRVTGGTITGSSTITGMGAVVAYARAQVGKPYRRGAQGPDAFDCSGFTMQAYRRAGIRLPHSSRGQAARARGIPRSAARPGDLVVGASHVGVYMGGGMMIDAGNPRVGVVYRSLYGGLHVARLTR